MKAGRHRAGRIAYPFMGPYAASKHAVEALSDSWRRELMLHGVVVIEPGAIQTPIWDKAKQVMVLHHVNGHREGQGGAWRMPLR